MEIKAVFSYGLSAQKCHDGVPYVVVVEFGVLQLTWSFGKLGSAHVPHVF